MSLETYLIYLMALAAFFATPPDTSQLLIISNSLRHGVKRSAATIFGDLTANSIQMTAAAFGLTAVIVSSASALFWIKWAGVAYLAWISLQLLLSKPAEKKLPGSKGSSFGSLFRQGFFTSMANPYAVVFFGALFPQFIDASHPILPQLFVLGITYLVVDGVLLLIWGWAAARTAGRVKNLKGVWINRISGLLMIAAAALLALKDLKVEPAR